MKQQVYFIYQDDCFYQRCNYTQSNLSLCWNLVTFLIMTIQKYSMITSRTSSESRVQSVPVSYCWAVLSAAAFLFGMGFLDLPF